MNFCRVCGASNEYLTPAYNGDAPVPQEGDATVCFKCGTLSIIRGGEAVEPTSAERADFLCNPDIVNVIALIKLEHG